MWFFYIELSWVRVNSIVFNVLLFLLLGPLFKNLIFLSRSHITGGRLVELTRVFFFDATFFKIDFVLVSSFNIKLLGFEFYNFFLIFVLWVISILYQISCYSKVNMGYHHLNFFFILKKSWYDLQRNVGLLSIISTKLKTNNVKIRFALQH